MSAFFDNSITDVGRQLWAEMQAGGTFVPTKIVVGAGYLPPGKTTRTMIAVAEPIQTIELNKQEKMPEGDYIIGGMFTNKEVENSFYYRELGLYAKVKRADATETAETLYSYGNAGDNAELIPAYSTETAIERQLDIITYIGNDATVKIEVATGVYVSKTELDSKLKEIESGTKDIEKELSETVKKVEGKDLSSNDFSDTDKSKVDNLPSDTNATLAELRDDVDSKVEKVSGKGLSTNDYTTTEKDKLSGIAPNATKNTVTTYTVSVNTSWTSATGYVQKTVTVNGILSTDTPIIDLITTTSGYEAEQEAWGKVFKVTTSTNAITLYASEAPTTAFNLQIKVVR